jgi:hypothetical protein
MRTNPLARYWILSVLLGTLAAWSCAGAPRLDIAVGFDSQVIRSGYAPVRVEVSGLAASLEGMLVLRQTQGLPGERQAPIAHVIASGAIENGISWATIPLSEPLNPLIAELRSADGQILAQCEKNLRLGIRQWAFPVIVGRSVGRTAEAVVDAAELPLDWWAYDAAREVWLLEAPVSEPALQALGEWVVSGGSLVLFTGASFPRLDSLTLRAILPLDAPHLVQLEAGRFRLAGDLRSGARVVRERGGAPLLIQRGMGAGTISLITVAVDDLSAEELSAVGADVPPVRRAPTTERVSAELLNSTSVPRPSYAVAPAIVVVLAVSLILFARYAERRPWTAGAVAGLIVVVAVLSGFYANSKKTFILQYSTITNISVVSSFGIHTAFSSFYAIAPRSVYMNHELGSYPESEQLQMARNGTFAAESEPGQTRFSLQAAERRDLLFHSRPRVEDLSFRLTGDELEIDNRTGRVLLNAYVAREGNLFPLPPIALGTQRIALQVKPVLGQARTAYLLLRGVLRPIEEWLPIDERGAWLITFEEESLPMREGVPEKAREVFMTLVEGDAT